VEEVAMMRAWMVCGVVLAALVLGRSDAVAQAYPVKPVRIIVPLAAGGLADILARVVAQRLGEVSGQSFVVENRTGAAGAVGGEAAARALPLGTPEELAAHTIAERVKWGDVIRRANIRLE
jgi:tripartite-type tricarboxylate transporter receptor subunit TctC